MILLLAGGTHRSEPSQAEADSRESKPASFTNWQVAIYPCEQFPSLQPLWEGEEHFVLLIQEKKGVSKLKIL